MAQVTVFTRPAVRVRIDLNARDADGLVPTRLKYADGYVAVGDTIIAFEPEDEVKAPATVVRIEGQFLYLAVAWEEMVDDIPAPQPVTLLQSPGRASGQRTGSFSSWVRLKVAAPVLAGAAAMAAITTPMPKALPVAPPVTPHSTEIKDGPQS